MFKGMAVLLLLILVVGGMGGAGVIGCASRMQSREELAAAAGFRVITPTKPDQQAILARLPVGQVTPVRYHGKLYYVLPDPQNNQAYVGGPRQFQRYQQLRLEKQISNQNLMAAQMNETAAMNWGTWGGWGAWGPMGWY